MAYTRLMSLELVPQDQLPREIGDAPSDPMVLYKTFLKMRDTCEQKGGIGLAAVQVGIPWRLFVIKGSEPQEKYGFFLDCQYEGIGEKKPSIEGCLSIRDVSGKLINYLVPRFPLVRVQGKQLIEGPDRPELRELDRTQDGVLSVVFQHEIDHGYGVLISDIGQPIQIW